MPEVVTCITCRNRMQVPDDLLGQDVQCPTCGVVFPVPAAASGSSSGAGLPPAPSPSPSRALARTRRGDWDGDDFDDRDDHRRRRRRRQNWQPHRGPMIMMFGILGLLFIVFGPLIVFGPIAWIMGNSDLQAIRRGDMDPEGESATNAGRVCGMIATILGGVMLVLAILLFCLWFALVFMMAAAVGTAPRHVR
jgi:hypothetical protein